MKTVLLLGSGVTRAARPGGAIKNQPPLDSDFFEIAKRITKKKTESVKHSLKSLVGDYSRLLIQSLETATTYLYIKAINSKRNSQYHKGFLEHLSLLNDVLAHTTNSLNTGPRTLIYRFLRNELLKAAPRDITIITFNYDLLIERVLEEINRRRDNEVFFFPGCYRLDNIQPALRVSNHPQFDNVDYSHDGVSVLKLHGSMNWQSIHNSRSPMPHIMFDPKRKLHVMNCRSIRTSLRWRRQSRRMYLKPVIVPPVSGKRGMIQAEVLKLWTKAATALLKADRVVIAGYSCPPLDLEARILISENMWANSNKDVYLINPNPNIVARFVDMCGVDHITVYTSISDWVSNV